MSSATPADVLARRRQLILNGDADGFADLFAPDAVIEFCFHGPPGTPVRLEGREAIREYSRPCHGVAAADRGLEVAELYQAQDPDGGDRGDAGEGDRDHDGPVDHGNVHPGPPDPGRPYRALPRLRRSPGLPGTMDDGVREADRVRESLRRARSRTQGRAAGGGRRRRAGRRARGGAQQRGRVLASGSCRCWPRTCASPPTTGRGLGGSAPAPGLVTIDRQIDDLASVITGLAAGPCVLAGHSWGGILVQLLAFRRPDLVAGLVLVDPGHEEMESASAPAPPVGDGGSRAPSSPMSCTMTPP